MGHTLAARGRRGARCMRAPCAHHCLALLHFPNAHGWPNKRRQMSAPSAPPGADGGAGASTINHCIRTTTFGQPHARVTRVRPRYPGTRPSRLGRAAGAIGGGSGEGSGRGRGPGALPGPYSQLPGRLGGETPTPPPPPTRDAPPAVFGERRRGPSQQPPISGPKGTATLDRCSGKARAQPWTRSCSHITPNPPPPPRAAR